MVCSASIQTVKIFFIDPSRIEENALQIIDEDSNDHIQTNSKRPSLELEPNLVNNTDKPDFVKFLAESEKTYQNEQQQNELSHNDQKISTAASNILNLTSSSNENKDNNNNNPTIDNSNLPSVTHPTNPVLQDLLNSGQKRKNRQISGNVSIEKIGNLSDLFNNSSQNGNSLIKIENLIKDPESEKVELTKSPLTIGGGFEKFSSVFKPSLRYRVLNRF